jgi:4-hydroxy-tetrahydrodipicolinate reductase
VAVGIDTKPIVVGGTGFVGRIVIAEIVEHPLFELVGVGVSNPEKVGRDVGEICRVCAHKRFRRRYR